MLEPYAKCDAMPIWTKTGHVSGKLSSPSCRIRLVTCLENDVIKSNISGPLVLTMMPQVNKF
jgi:hypothetical protein